jgi:hypothetical protein
MSGTKNDKGKPPIQLIPYAWIAGVARILAFGAEKYAPWNWTKGFQWSRLGGATLRHVGAWLDGEDNDPETGENHLLHASCELMFAYCHQLFGLGEDDRKKWVQPVQTAAGSAAEYFAIGQAVFWACGAALFLVRVAQPSDGRGHVMIDVPNSGSYWVKSEFLVSAAEFLVSLPEGRDIDSPLVAKGERWSDMLHRSWTVQECGIEGIHIAPSSDPPDTRSTVNIIPIDVFLKDYSKLSV